MLTAKPRFNFYLCAVLALVAGGCATGAGKEKNREASLRFHLEVNAVPGGQGTNVVLGRSAPFTITVDLQPFLSEFLIEKATVVDTLGGFAISVQFNQQGAILLEQYTTAYKGRRAGILGEFGEVRWLAAPVMQSRIASGQFVFTPDATRVEAERIVSGVNRVAELVRKGRK